MEQSRSNWLITSGCIVMLIREWRQHKHVGRQSLCLDSWAGDAFPLAPIMTMFYCGCLPHSACSVCQHAGKLTCTETSRDMQSGLRWQSILASG